MISERFAAAAALYDNGPLLQVQAAREDDRAPVAWGIMLAYVVGKPIGILGAARGRAGLG